MKISEEINRCIEHAKERGITGEALNLLQAAWLEAIENEDAEDELRKQTKGDK